MNLFKAIFRKNKDSHGGLSVFAGGVVIILSLLFSEGYSSSLGLFGSLPSMRIKLADEKHKTVERNGLSVVGSDRETVLVRDEIVFPLRYFLFVGSVFIFVGIYTYFFDTKTRKTD